MATKTKPRTLSDQQLIEMLGLLREADTVELKSTIPADDQRSVISALGLDPLDAQIRQVFFFDTPDLKLDSAGVVVRARRVQRKGDDTVVKLRPVVPADMPESVAVEVDAMPGGFVCSGSMKGVPRKAAVKDVVTGGEQLRKLFTKEQRAFFSDHAPQGVALDDLAVLGPIFVLKLKMVPEGYARKLVTELWLYPDDTRILELSTKCGTHEAFQVAAETRAYLAERGVVISGEQQTKTRTALEFFSKKLG
jgi:hypothetical protein